MGLRKRTPLSIQELLSHMLDPGKIVHKIPTTQKAQSNDAYVRMYVYTHKQDASTCVIPFLTAK